MNTAQPPTSVLQESGRSASIETFVLYLKSVLRLEFSAKIRSLAKPKTVGRNDFKKVH